MLTHERLLELIDYDPTTGILKWKVPRPGVRAGSVVCPTPQGSGYLQCVIDTKHYYQHRVIWFYVTGEWPPAQIDHTNGIRSDNKWENLRLARPSDNSYNRAGTQSSGVKGVMRKRGKFMPYIDAEGKRYYLGVRDTLEEAKEVVSEARNKLHGMFANHGNIC